jgi:hypothetical protein
MLEKFEQVKKKLSDMKNVRLDEQITELSNNIESDISANLITNVFEIAEKFDETIQTESKKANFETLSYLYKKCYEGLKAASFLYFGNSTQSQKYETNLLQERVGFYQNSLNRVQSESLKRN